MFVIWRLAGTLPRNFETVGRTVLPSAQSAGKLFAAHDRELDRATSGPLWLKDARVAGMVVEALEYGVVTRGFYDLHAFVVMPNHVHVVWTPKIAMPRILQWLKGVTAKRGIGILGLTGGPFWQDESYDHWVRSWEELQRVIRYVEWNPVKAGLAKSVEEWPWSSATPRADDKIVRATAPSS